MTPLEQLFAGLRDRDYAREGLFVLEGRLVLEKALAAGIAVAAALCVPADAEEWTGRLPAGTPLQVLPRPEMEQLVGFAFHRGVLALGVRPRSASPAGSDPKPETGSVALGSDPVLSGSDPRQNAASGGRPRRYLALWQVSDPDNLGALIRSAAALGFDCVILGPGCADPLGRKALRSGMGCALSLPLVSVADIGQLRAACSDSLLLAAALHLVALTPDELYARLPADRDLVLILGNEGWGLPAEMVAAADYAIQIPMANQVDSLNVGAAGAILMWELTRASRS
ncbi:MAG: RNA methyltransferase [Spirochaetes bacterium]|nr:RNA methyltransferase [Spirochaetota bacterium]